METSVREIMVEDVVTVGPQMTIEDAMALMTEKRIRHLPVIEGTKIVGVISIGDLVKSIIADQEFTINQLENYIRGGVDPR
jgi:IMP dehydrogenase